VFSQANAQRRVGMGKISRRLVLLSVGLAGFLSALTDAHAVPSFARQTGLECVACHLSWLELTTVGRQFKLGGYTLMKPVTSGERPLVSFARDGNPPLLPLAGFVQASLSHTANTSTAGTDASSFPMQDELALQQFSLFLAGRISDHAGGFAQWTYDGLGHTSSIDNVDLRLVNRYKNESLDVSFGLSLNNSPTGGLHAAAGRTGATGGGTDGLFDVEPHPVHGAGWLSHGQQRVFCFSRWC
jgi:hypothetical protein